MGIFDEDPQDPGALVSQLGGTPPDLPPEILTQLMRQMRERGSSPPATAPHQPAPTKSDEILRQLRVVANAGAPQQPVTSLPRPPVLSARKPGSERPMPVNDDEVLARAGNLPELLNQTPLGLAQDFTDPLSMVDAAASMPIAAVKRLGGAAKAPPLSHLERAPAESILGHLLVSTRLPSSVKAQKQTAPLMTGMEEVLQAPDLVEKFAAEAREYPILTAKQAKKGDESVLRSLLEATQSNYEFLLEKMKPYAERSKLWYDGANKIANNMAQEFGFHPDQASGVLAVLSPQQDWHQNAEMARRTIQNYRKFVDEGTVFSPEIGAEYARTTMARAESKIKGWKPALANAYRAETTAEMQRVLGSLNGRSFSELDLDGKAIMMRAYDVIEHGLQYPILTPEGGIARTATTKEGIPSMLKWQSYRDVKKAISILEDGSVENISQRLGNEHKVRSFFDNISNPNYGRLPGERGPSTIDTHAVAGGHLQPLAQKSREADYAMSGAGNALLGISGMNPVYQEALTRTGKGAGLLPREAQSITWEGLKGLFSPAQKSNKQFMDKITKLWQDYNRGKASLRSVQDAIYNEAGGITPPDWAR